MPISAETLSSAPLGGRPKEDEEMPVTDEFDKWYASAPRMYDPEVSAAAGFEAGYARGRAAQQVAEADAAARDDAVKMFMASKDVLAVVVHEEHSVIAEVSIYGTKYDDAQMDRLLEIEELHHKTHPGAWLSFRYLPNGSAA